MADYSGARGGRRDAANTDGASQREPLCPICMALLRNQAVGTPECCDHRFCLSCLREWAKSVNTCPIDRQPFNIIRCQSTAKSDVSRKTIYVDNRAFPSADDPTYCEVCKRCNLENQLLLCDGCERGYHLRCLNPPLNAVPSGEWYCTRCLRIISAAMRSRTVRTSATPNSSSSTDGDHRRGGRHACRRGRRKGSTAPVVIQRTSPMVRVSGRRTSAGGRVARLQPEVPETCPTDDKADANANSSERAEASDKDVESDLDDSDENSSEDDDDSDEDYHPRSVKLNRHKPRSSTKEGRGKRGRGGPYRSARGRLPGNKRGMGRKSTCNVKPDGQRHPIAKEVLSRGKAKGKKERKKAKKSATRPLVKKSSVVLRPLQLAARSPRLNSGNSSRSIHDTETAGNCTSNDEATQPGPSCSLLAIAGTGIVDRRIPLSNIAAQPNKCGDARFNAECSDDAYVSSSEECPPLVLEADVPVLHTTRSPPLLDMQCETAGASQQSTVSRISRHEKAERRSKSRACDSSGNSSTAAVASSASSKFCGRMANAPGAKKTKIMTDGRSTSSGQGGDKLYANSRGRGGGKSCVTSRGRGGDKLCAPVSLVLRLGMSETAGPSMQAAVGCSVSDDNALPISVMNEAYGRPSLSDGQVSVSSSPGARNRPPLSADTPYDNQQNTVASEPCTVGTTEAKISVLALVSECAERVPTSFCERSSNDKPTLGEGAASAISAAAVTLAESRCSSVSESANDGKSHLSSRKSPPAATDSRLVHSERTVPAALGTAPPFVTTDCMIAACSDAPGTSRRNVTADCNTLAESSRKLELSFKKVRRGPRTPSPPPPPSSDDDDHRSRSPVRHRKRQLFTSFNTAPTERSPGSADDAKAAPSALPVADGGPEKRLSAPKVRTDHKPTETSALGPQSALNCRPERDCTKAAAEQGNEIDSHECVRLSEASGVSKSSVVRSTVSRETLILNRVYRGHYRDRLDSRVSLDDESNGYTGSTFDHSSGGLIARRRASDARSSRGFDRLSYSDHSRTADRYANRADTYRYVRTAQPGCWSASRAARQDERNASIKVPHNFNGPLLPHSDMRQYSSRSEGIRRPPLMLDCVAAATAELGRVPHVESRSRAYCHPWTMNSGDHDVENEEWAECGNGDVDCDAFMDRYESGEVDYHGDYEDYYEAGGGGYEADGDDYEAGGGDYEAGGGDYEAGGGDYEAGGGDYEANYDGGRIFYDDNKINCYDNRFYWQHMVSVNKYQRSEYLSTVDSEYIVSRGGQMVASGEISTRTTRNSSRIRWRTGGYDGAEMRHGSFSAGRPVRCDQLPLPAGSARLFPGCDALRDSRMPTQGAFSSSPSSTQWLAEWLQMNTMQSIPSVTPDLARGSSNRGSHQSPHFSADSVYRGASRLIPRGQSVRGVRGNASLLDSPIRGEMHSLPRDPRVRSDRVESSRASAVPAAVPRRCDAPPSSASAAGFAHKMSNPECNGRMPTGKGSQSMLVPEAEGRADTRRTNMSGSSTTAAAAEIPESKDDGGSPMSLCSEHSPSGAASPDRFSLVSVAVSRTPSPSAFTCEQGQLMFRGDPTSSVIASAASTTDSTIAETSSVVTVGGSAAAASMVPLAVAPASVSPTALCGSSSNLELVATAAAKTEDPKVREIAVIVERHLMGPHMTGRIDTVTYKAIAKKAVFKIYKQEKGSKLDESRIQKLVEAYVREADLPNMPRLK